MDRFIRLFIYLCFVGSGIVAQNTSPVIRFGLFADTQYGDCPPGNTRFYRQALQKLDTCIDCLINKMFSLLLIWEILLIGRIWI